jgi:hypothetical protein
MVKGLDTHEFSGELSFEIVFEYGGIEHPTP